MTTETETNEAPGVLDRIANIWAKKKETAQATYARLLKRAELDQKPLTDSETSALAEAMRCGGITLELAEYHRELCQKVLSNRPVAAQLQSAKEAGASAQVEWDRLAKAIAALQRQQQLVFEMNLNEAARLRRAESAVQTITSCAEQLAAIGITV